MLYGIDESPDAYAIYDLHGNTDLQRSLFRGLWRCRRDDYIVKCETSLNQDPFLYSVPAGEGLQVITTFRRIRISRHF